MATGTQQEFAAFYRDLSRDFGTRLPHVFAEAVEHPAPTIRWRPLLTENVHPQILVGYGDPAVIKTDEGCCLVATSNDAPDAFPILHSNDLDALGARAASSSREGREPGWSAKGRKIADFWAPEIARVGEEYWLCFTARQGRTRSRSGWRGRPARRGPWIDNGAPLITGEPVNTTGLGSIRPAADERRRDRRHIFVDANGDTYLFWKDDRNSIWPRPLAMLLREHPELIEQMFESDEDRRTAAFAAAIVRWANERGRWSASS